MSSILVIGAGELGDAVLSHLATHPNKPKDTTISLLVRPSTIETPSPHHLSLLEQCKLQGVSLVPGDIAALSESELAAIFASYGTVLSCTGFSAGPGSQRKLARAVLAAGVPRYFPWQFGADYDAIGFGSAQPVFDEQLEVRNLLRAQAATRWTIISTGIFTSFLFWAPFGIVEPHAADGSITVRALGSWDTTLTVTSPDGIGRMTADALYGDLDEIVYIAGDTISYAQVADIVRKVTGRAVSTELWDLPLLQTRLQEAPDDVLAKYRVVFAQGKGVSWDASRTLNATRGIHLETAEEWARSNFKL
ncbi:isoflavone reductase [Auricularia subglabra TFB-10046 SS5]|nr:isoflavone reductase [Auricularia subglabra TFB-10046 SS5]